MTYEFGDFRLDPARRLLTRSDGRAIEITSKAFDALTHLVAHAGTPVARSELAGALWPRTIVEDNSLSKLIVTLRRALGETDEHRYIATLPGRGYQFVAAVRRVEAQPFTEPETAQSARTAGQSMGLSPTDLPPQRRGPVFVIASIVVVSLAAVAFAALRFAPARPGAGGAGTSTPLGTPVHVTPITSRTGYELAPTLSPDGESVAFSWDGQGGDRNLYVTRIGGSGMSRLTDAAEPDRFPAWSPDGAHIAFLREMGPDSFDLMVVPAPGGRERRFRNVHVRPTAVYASPMVTWSDFGEAVVFTTRSGDEVASSHHLYQLSIASGETVQLTAGDNVYDTSPAVSADGRRLAFVRHDGSSVHGRGTLMVQSLSGDAAAQKPVEVHVPSTPGNATAAYVIHSPSWSRDGRFLTFVLGTDLLEWELGAPASRVVYPGTGRLGGLTLAGDVSAITMVRDGGRARAVVASIDRSSDIFALPLAPATHEAIGPPAPRFPSSAGETHPRFSPDGRRVAFVSARDGLSDVWVGAADASEPWRITDMQSRIVGFPRWSPDGRRIAFHAFDGSERQIYFVDPEAGAPQRIAAGCCLEWSRDGEHLYVTDLGADHTISRIRVADGQRERLFAGGFPGLTADGSTLLYGKVGERSIYARAVSGDVRNNPEQLLVTDSSYPSATAATIDGFFYVRYSSASERGQIRFYDYATRRTRAIADVPAGVGEVLTLSPDGTELLYAAQSESGADLWLLDFGD